MGRGRGGACLVLYRFAGMVKVYLEKGVSANGYKVILFNNVCPDGRGLVQDDLDLSAGYKVSMNGLLLRSSQPFGVTWNTANP